MARYRHVDLSPRLLPVDLESQLVPGTFAHAVHHLVDDLDLSAFDAYYRNDDNGAPAHSPTMLLKVVLLAYSQGLVSSRRIERACRDNVLFIAIRGDAKPHFTTIADFISRSRDAITSVFGQVLCVLSGEGLIGRAMAAGAPAPVGTSHIPVGRLLSMVSSFPRMLPSTALARVRNSSLKHRRWKRPRVRCSIVIRATMPDLANHKPKPSCWSGSNG